MLPVYLLHMRQSGVHIVDSLFLVRIPLRFVILSQPQSWPPLAWHGVRKGTGFRHELGLENAKFTLLRTDPGIFFPKVHVVGSAESWLAFLDLELGGF